ncbi:MAG TPA: prolyl oligopeptidase family serine peptidase [Chloroflexi bacterium]|nr:prolyl oligopeptidase family serine peptidase [Chloroflexota bacterium]
MTSLPVVPESLYDLVTVEDPRFSPDGKTIAFVRMQPDGDENCYRRQIYLIPADGSAPARPFTRGKQDFSPRWSPDGSQLVFVSARSGRPQLYRMPVTGGEPVQLTFLPGGAVNPAWSPDGRWIAFNSSSTRGEHALEDSGQLHDPRMRAEALDWSGQHRESLRDPRTITRLPYRTGTSFFDGQYSHVYIIPAAGGAPKRLSNGDFHHAAPDWTPDSRMVVTNSNREQSSGDEFFELWSSIIGFDIETGAEKVLVSEVTEEGRPARVSPDGQWVAHAFVPKVPSPYAEPYYAAVSSMDTGETRIISDDADLTVIDFSWAPDSQSLFATIHHHGEGRLVRLARTGGQPETLVSGRRMVQSFSVSQDGRKVAFTLTSPTLVSELFVLDLEAGQERQLTAFNREWESTHFLSDPQTFWYTGADDVQVQGWIFRPRNFDPAKRYPLAVEIHGGPQIMWGDSFWHEFQVLTSRGYFVFFCNPRGSAGYGAHFQRIRGNGGYTDMADIMTGLDQALAMEPAADPERLTVTGGSYGGFLTGWIVGHTDRFKAAVSQRGVYDELNMFGSGDIPESVEWYHNGIPRPETLMELWEYSPAAYAEKVTTPLKILHSELDYRVPISQAETFFAYLRRYGNRDAVMVRFPREGHELSRSGEPRHRVRRLYEIVTWFDRYVQPERLQPCPLDDEALQQALATLPGWQLEGGALVRSFEAGNFTLALALAGRVGALAEEAGYAPGLCLKPDGRLVLRLTNCQHGAVTDAEERFARILNQRLFNN